MRLTWAKTSPLRFLRRHYELLSYVRADSDPPDPNMILSVVL